MPEHPNNYFPAGWPKDIVTKNTSIVEYGPLNKFSLLDNMFWNKTIFLTPV